MADNHPFNLGFICRRKLSSEIPQNSQETLENSTIIGYIGHSSFKVKFYTDDRGKLSKIDENTSQNIDDSSKESKIDENLLPQDVLGNLIDKSLAETATIPIDKIIHLNTT